MEILNPDELERFMSTEVEVSIQDKEGRDRAPFLRKRVKKVTYCPDRTHIRFYFDQVHFLAIPVSSDVTETEDEWSAFDSVSELRYVIRKVNSNI